MKILMVCLGNICRSPVAEGVMRHKIALHGLPWIVHSAGTESYHVGQPPHRFSQEVCIENGIDISGQRAMKFVASHFVQYDIIYAFAHDVYNEIRRIGGRLADMSKVDYFLNALYKGGNRDVPDPYYGTVEGYKTVFRLIDKTCDAIIDNHKTGIYIPKTLFG